MRMRPFALLALTLALAACNGETPDTAAPAEPEPLQLLTSEFGELCTMCEAVLVCGDGEPGTQLDADGLPAKREHSVYYLETRDFWGQIASIYDWFMILIDPVRVQVRPMYAMARPDEGNRILHTTTELNLDTAQISIPGGYIDRNDARRYAANGRAAGACTRMDIRAGVPWVKGQRWYPAADGTMPVMTLGREVLND